MPYVLSLSLGDTVKRDNTWVVHEKNFTAPIVDGDLELKLSDILAGEDIIFRSLHTGITLSPQGAGAKAPTHRMTDTVTQLGWQTTNSTRDLDVEASPPQPQP